MSVPTMQYAESHDVVGRSAELDQIRSIVSGHDASLLLLDGEAGVGKTAIANRIVEMANAGALADLFSETYTHSIYHESWGRVLSQLAAALLNRETVLKATEHELEQMLLHHCASRCVLLVIDNLEPRSHPGALGFLQAWANIKGDSVLLVTSVEPLDIRGKRIARMTLGGLQAPTDQVELLGPSLRRRFGGDVLLEAASPLKGLPLDLLYLRWLDPHDAETLATHVHGLVEDTLDKSTSLTDLLFGLARSATFFTALGIVRQLQFDESLLAYLWDSIGGGNTAAYVERREQFVEARLLATVRGQSKPTYRISEEIHKHLYRSLVPTVGKTRIPTFHYFVGEYYRGVFEASTPPDIQALDSFIHHCLERGDRARAYDYLFSDNLLQRLHQAGMALQLRDTLQAFFDHKMGTQTPFERSLQAFMASEAWTSIQKCKLLLELAHVYSDLGEYDKSLMLSVEADALLTGNSSIDTYTRHDLQRQVWYYAAVSHSNIGRSDESLRSYFRIAAAPVSADPFGCLALGYLAHCALKYHDLDQARDVGVEAVALAREIGDNRVLIKNLCSVGETHIYAGDKISAAKCFEEAYDLIGGPANKITDQRELGRLLIHWGVLEMVNNRPSEAQKRLSHGRNICLSVNDRRRATTAEMYLSILDHRHGKQEDGHDQLLNAVVALHAQRDGRYLIPAFLTYWSWMEPKLEGTMADLARGGPGELTDRVGGPLPAEDRYAPFADYWRNHFRPTLLL